ncbi:uncharacterized protein LOC134251791 [Saccostrea cucullata]|uniref:uncharacterized protein LOC134251791 n=1 Tax=Saccostrea cuccullata TaxID=36930 RepID=UPI002ED27C47
MEKKHIFAPIVQSSIITKEETSSSEIAVKEKEKTPSPSTLSPSSSPPSMKEKDETPSPPVRCEMSRYDSASSTSEFSQSSLGSSDENKMPKNFCRCSVDLVDKFGIKKVQTSPFRLIWEQWHLVKLSKAELARIDTIADVCDFRGFNFQSLEEIPYEEDMPFSTFGKEWFAPPNCADFKFFSYSLEEFRFRLFDIIKQIQSPRKGENEEPFEIEYNHLFESLLKLFEFRTKYQPQFPRGHATLFSQEIFSKADIIGQKCDEPEEVLFVCKVKRKCPDDESEYSPIKKKLRSTTELATVTEEATSSMESNIGIPSNVVAQHVGELLSYMEKSVLNRGLLGMVIQKTNIMFTYLKIEPASYEKIRGRKKPVSVRFHPGLQEEPVLFYTDQYNFLKKYDRREIFKALIAVKMMERKVSRT